MFFAVNKIMGRDKPLPRFRRSLRPLVLRGKHLIIFPIPHYNHIHHLPFKHALNQQRLVGDTFFEKLSFGERDFPVSTVPYPSLFQSLFVGFVLLFLIRGINLGFGADADGEFLRATS